MKKGSIKIGFKIGVDSGDDIEWLATDTNAPDWIKSQVQSFRHGIESDGRISTYVAMAMHIAHHHKDAEVTLITDRTFTQKNIDALDVLFVQKEGTETLFNEGEGISEYRKYFKIIEKAKCFVYCPPDYQKYIADKEAVYEDLKRAGVPFAPYFSVDPKKIRTESDARKLKERIANSGWKGFILKSVPGCRCFHIRPFLDVKRARVSTILEYFKTAAQDNYYKTIVQEFVERVGKNYELRTYWVNGKYTHTHATLTPAKQLRYGIGVEKQTTFRKEGGVLPDELLIDIKKMGRRIQKAVLQYGWTQPLMRIDFACCLEKGCSTYFLNEIEGCAPGILSEVTEYPIVEKLAETFYRFAVARKGERNKPGKQAVLTQAERRPIKACFRKHRI